MKPNYRRSTNAQIILLLIATPALSDFQWPLKEKTYITGSFGEFRKHHIHAGVDISTNGRIGMPVYAGETGILYRVKTQFLGFGKAVYILLPDGKFLVYAHLDRFSPKIDKIVTDEQKKEKRYEVDVYIKEKIIINKGDTIGYSGDTGGVAPHLHIELRDPDERPINPSIHLKDTTPPVISGLAICNPITTNRISHYSAKNIPNEIKTEGKIGVAVSIYDPSYGNKIGVYELSLIVDEKLFFSVKMDQFSYDEFKDNFILCNKNLYVNYNNIYYHLFRAFNNKLPFYPAGKDGILDLPPGKHSIKIEAKDFAGNKTTLKFNIDHENSLGLPRDKPNIRPGDIKGIINIKKEDLYYPFQVKINTTPGKQWKELVPVSEIYDTGPKEAVFKKGSIDLQNTTKLDRIGLFRYEDGKWKYMDDNTITNLTKFALFRDITPPNIKIISRYPVFRAVIFDNGSGLDYNKLSLYIDGEKVIAEYSVNRKELFYAIPKEKHNITCIAEDKTGNVNKIELKETRSN